LNQYVYIGSASNIGALRVNAGAGCAKLVCGGVESLVIAATNAYRGSQSSKTLSDSFADAAIPAGNERHVIGKGASKLAPTVVSSVNSGHVNSSFLRPRFLCDAHLSLLRAPGKRREPGFRRLTIHLMNEPGKSGCLFHDRKQIASG
jgi:hypothetical protein